MLSSGKIKKFLIFRAALILKNIQNGDNKRIAILLLESIDLVIWVKGREGIRILIEWIIEWIIEWVIGIKEIKIE
jgi:hypothetical protein